jgi:CubicO group peptidase (beta-lactamase class C family)
LVELRCLLLLAAAMASCAVAASSTLADAEIARRKAVDGVFAEYERPGSPGVAVGIYRDGQPPYLRAYGLADLEQNVPMTPQSRIHIASTSKQFTAFAIALLAREGKVKLDADVHTYLPWLPDYGRQVTVADLVHHTSGLKDQWSLLTLAGRDYRDVLKQGQILELVARQRTLDFEPRSESEYSNTNYTLLAEIVSAVSGKSLRQFCTERIFEPLGMRGTFFYDNVDEVVPGRANSYERGPTGAWMRGVLSYETVGATSLLTTAEDMVKWAKNLAHPTVGDAALIRQLGAPVSLADGTPITYGFGLQRARFAGHDVLVHEGSDAAFTSSFTFYPGEGFAVAILANTVIDSTWKPATAVANIYLNGGSGTPIINAPLVGRPDRNVLASAAGHYFNEYRPLQEITVENGELWLGTAGGERQRAIFRDDGSFDFGDRMWTYYRFRHGEHGAVTALEEISARNLGKSRIYTKSKRATPSTQELRALEGEYRNGDLDVTYRARVIDGRLTLRSVWKTVPVPLTPSVANRFDTPDWSMRVISFERGPGGCSFAMRVQASRARNLVFCRI